MGAVPPLVCVWNRKISYTRGLHFNQYWARYHQVMLSRILVTLSFLPSLIGCRLVLVTVLEACFLGLPTSRDRPFSSHPNGHEFALAGGWRPRNFSDFCLTYWARPRLGALWLTPHQVGTWSKEAFYDGHLWGANVGTDRKTILNCLIGQGGGKTLFPTSGGKICLVPYCHLR